MLGRATVPSCHLQPRKGMLSGATLAARVLTSAIGFCAILSGLAILTAIFIIRHRATTGRMGAFLGFVSHRNYLLLCSSEVGPG
jgi:hypothetical protein